VLMGAQRENSYSREVRPTLAPVGLLTSFLAV